MKHVLLLAALVGCAVAATAQMQPATPLLDINTGAPAMSVDYSPDGRSLVTGGQSHDITVWNALSGERVMTLKGHTDDVVAVRYSPDGQLIASGGGDNKVKIWDVATGLLVTDLSGNQHTAEVEKVVFNPDGSALASVSRDGTLKVWRTPRTETRIAACAYDAMQKWSVWGEFEKTDDYRKRMDRKDRQAEQTTRDCRERIVNKFSNTADWQAFAMGPYDADSETYLLKSRLFGDKYRIKVAPRDAERVRANFTKTMYGVPSFEVDEYNAILLKRVDVTIPLDDRRSRCNNR